MSEADWVPPEQDPVQEDQDISGGKSSGDILRGCALGLIILIVLFFLFSSFSPAMGSKADLTTPSGSAEEFFRRLTDHEYDKADAQLSTKLSQQVSIDDLHVLVYHIEIQRHWLPNTKADTVSIQGDNAVAALHLVSTKGVRLAVQIPLHKENGEWRIASIDPLWELIRQITHPDLVTF